MSFIPGETLPDFLARNKPSQETRNAIGIQLLELFNLQLHRLDQIHADPHPGNYLIDADRTIGLVDFGCVKKFSAEFIELMRAFEERAWLRGDEQAQRMAYLIWGAQASAKPQVARKLLEQAIEFYEMLFPASGRRAVVDFGSDRILNAMFRIWNNCLGAKTVNPEFAFYTRAEMGLYNLLHLLRAKIDTSAALGQFYERIAAKNKH